MILNKQTIKLSGFIYSIFFLFCPKTCAGRNRCTLVLRMFLQWPAIFKGCLSPKSFGSPFPSQITPCRERGIAQSVRRATSSQEVYGFDSRSSRLFLTGWVGVRDRQIETERQRQREMERERRKSRSYCLNEDFWQAQSTINSNLTRTSWRTPILERQVHFSGQSLSVERKDPKFLTYLTIPVCLPTCRSANARIRVGWYIQSIKEYFIVTRLNQAPCFTGKRRELNELLLYYHPHYDKNVLQL